MKKLLFILISLLIGIGITLICLELFLRLNKKFGYIYNSFRFRSEKLAMHPQTFNYLQPSTLLGYEYIPNCKGVKRDINSYGLVGKEYEIKKDKNTFRILLLGDSIAEQGWSGKFLEDELNNNLKLHSRYKFEIWNAGVASYDVRRYAIYLKHKGLRYAPDMVIIFLFMNDFNLNINVYYKNQARTTEYYFPITEISKRYTVNPFLMRHSYLYRFIVLRIDSYLLNKKRTEYINPQEEDGRYYLQMIKEICENKKIPLFVAIFPYLKPLDEYKDKQIIEYKCICKVVKDLKIAYVNLYEHLLSDSLSSLRDNKEDEIHPSLEGHRIIARIIYDYLLDNFFNIH